MKICKTCGVLKPLDAFYRFSKAKDRRYGDCIECRREKNRRWWQENRSKDARICRWCSQPLERYQRKYHPECLQLAERAQSNDEKWQCAPGQCRHYASCVITVRLGARLPCQPENVEPIPVHSLEVISEFDGISLTISAWSKEDGLVNMIAAAAVHAMVNE